MSESDLAAILCSRLCHDLVSPVGAMSNGIEMLLEDDDDDAEMRHEALKLVEMSAAQASNRLQFFRLAFGAAGGMIRTIPIAEAEKAASGLFDGEKLKLQWESTGGECSKPAIRLLLNMILVATETLIRGGTVSVSMDRSGGETTFAVRAEGQGARIRAEISATVEAPVTVADLEPRTAPAYLARTLAESLGGRLSLRIGGNDRIALMTTVRAG